MRGSRFWYTTKKFSEPGFEKSSDLKVHFRAIPSLSSLSVLFSFLENICLSKQEWLLHFGTIFHIPVGLISSLTISPSDLRSSSKALTESCIQCLSCQCLEGAVTQLKGQQCNQVSLEFAAEPCKQAGGQDNLLSSLM